MKPRRTVDEEIIDSGAPQPRLCEFSIPVWFGAPGTRMQFTSFLDRRTV
jgi:hypothetical protein